MRKQTGIDEDANGHGADGIYKKNNFLTGIPEDRKGMGNETVTDSKPGGNGDRKGDGN